MSTMVSKTKIEEFPQKAQAFLEAVYIAHQVAIASTPSDRIKALRKAFQLEDMIIACDGGAASDADELRALEFYVLTAQGLL